MTTAPKVNRYRIRRAPVTPAASPGTTRPDAAVLRQGMADALMQTPEDGFDPEVFRPTGAPPSPAQAAPPVPPGDRLAAAVSAGKPARAGANAPPAAPKAAPEKAAAPAQPPMTPDEEIAAIQAEGLNGRQLRMARRLAHKHGIEADSDFEAVRQLRKHGIDPFDRSALLTFEPGSQPRPAGDDAAETPQRGLVKATGKALAKLKPAARDIQMPGPAPSRAAGGTMPPLTEADRVREIMAIQRDIARRRRRKLAMLALRLAFFVFLPTLIAGWYYYRVATPMYATKSEFVIQKADSAAGAAGLGGLFSGTQLATNQDSVTVQSYLLSRDAMMSLESQTHFKEHFSQPSIDRLQRLPADASNEAAYKIYQKNVKIGYDPSEGVIRMEVIAADPATSLEISKVLIKLAEGQVDRLTSRLREDQMQGARESYDDAESKVFAAQSKVLQLQEQVGVLDPVSENSLVMGQLSTLQSQLQQKRLELNQLLDNTSPSAARVQGARGDISRMEAAIAQLRSQLTEKGDGTASLAAVTGQLRIAEADLQTRQGLLATAAQQMEAARIEANKQVRYLETGVRPVAPDEPTYPRAFESTMLAFLIAAGVYLMLSLTASILREQVSS